MTDAPIHVVVAAFDFPDGASNMLETLEAARTMGLDTIDDGAVVIRDADGNLHIEEPGDWGGGRGAVVGGIVGAALALLAGPVGWAVGLGAAIGGLAARLRDSGFSGARLSLLGESLTPGTSVLVVAVDQRWAPTLEQLLADAGAVTQTEEIGADIAHQLEADRGGFRTALRGRRRPRPASTVRYF